MASQCKRQQCTIDRRGFRQELDSWRHKLIHCVGFESILEGLFGTELVEDLKLFKDLEPVAVSDWSFYENCLFCCLRRDKVKEYLNNKGSEDIPKPLLVKDQTTISRLEKQAEEFLSAVLSKKDVPNFLDPHIPVVAREILQRMIRQFAAEYTSQTSSPQDSCSDTQPCSDQSLPTPPLLSGAPPSTSPAATLAGLAHNQNPVLSKLLMADQDAPLDLTIKKPLPEPSEQDGVLDLSLKKNRSSSNLSVRSPCLSPATSTLKGESPDLHDAKAKDLQSTSTLEQFMAKLCPHHQRQIVDAIGFLQTEVKALTASNRHQASNSTSGIQEDVCSTAKSTAVTPEKSCPEQSFPSESAPKPELQDISRSGPSSCAMQNTPENAVSLKASVSADPALDLCSPRSGSNHGSVTPTTNPVDTENNRHSDHAPLRMKIMTSSVADGKKLSCVLNASFSPHSDICDDRQGNSNSSNRTETHSARLSSSIKRHSQASHTHQARQKETLEHSKDTPDKLFSVHMTIPSDSARTARKTVRTSSDQRTRDSACRGIADPDLGHCDIVFIDKPITECYKEQHRSMLRRRNARKSTRGHMYSDEIWELKTVRTLAGKGNCPNPIPELITLITPKQILSKPEGVPPVDMPFVGPCREMNQQMSTEESDESVIPGTGDVVEVAASEVDVIVETSQTGQTSQSQSPPPSLRSPKENTETDMNTNVEQDTTADSGAAGSEEGVAQALFEAEKHNEPETQEDIQESTEQIVAEIGVEILEKVTIEESEPQNSSDKLQNSEPALQQNSPPSPVNTFEDETQENQREEIQDEQTQERQPEKQIHYNNFEATETSNTTVSAEEPMVKGTEVKTSEAVDSLMPLEHEDNEYDVSSKTLDALLKELPPWRRKRGTVILLPKRLRQTKTVIVGYVNGRPISASDRSLRRRSSNSTTSPTKISAISSQNVPNKNPLDSTVENKHLDKPLPETYIPAKPIPTTTVIEQVTEPCSDVALTTIRKVSPRVKQIQKQKRVQRDQDSLPVFSDHTQSPESTRLLRSASLKSAGSTVSQPTSNAVTCDSSPKPADTHALPSTEQNPSITLPTSFPDTSPLIMSSPPAAFEQSQQSVPETSAGLNIEKSSQVETTSEDIQNTIQKNEVDNTLQAKQKLRSAKAVTDSKYENQQLSAEVSSPLENQSPVKTEMQTKIMPLRRKRVLRKEVEASNIALPQKPNVASLEDGSASGDDSSTSTSDKPTRMPLRSESSKAEVLHQPVTQSLPVDSKKLALRSQRLAAPSTSAVTVSGRQSDIAPPIRKPERITKAAVKPDPLSVESVFTQSSAIPVITPRPEPPKQTVNKFFETLTGEESQHLISNLNLKYDKMQKGWVQMDKEGQPTTRYKSKADRQAAIWKSKRRTRKTKSSEHQKYSPVQMLFMKGFNLSSICRWFLESTETKSLVIVKKVNTRLPSETQLCFHSSSSSSGTSQGVFPSLQAERLKKHLKKFAIASPVKSNPKSQKLIAKALGQEANAVKGKERRELSSSTQTLPKSHCIPIGESQKSTGKSKNPASARILRKYSNIREKMQGQQTNVRMKKASKTLKTNNIKRLTTTKAAAKSNLKPSLKAQKPALSVSKRMKEAAAKMVRRKTLAGKKTRRHLVQERAVKAQSRGRASRDATRKELPKRYSQRLGSPKVSEYNPVDTSKSKVDNKKQIEAEKVEVEKSAVNKMNAKPQTKESSQSTLFELKGNENVIEIPQQSMDVKFPTSLDQVLTRSQRKMETTVPFSGSPSHVPKRASKSTTTQNASPKSVRKAEKATLTRSGALKSSAKRSRTALLPRGATKSAKKRAQELLETPAKRTRTSLSK